MEERNRARKWKLETRKWKTENWKVTLGKPLISLYEFRFSDFQFLNSSAHRADFFRLDFVGHAHFAGLAVRIDGIAQIFLREFVDVIVRTLFGNFHDLAANFKIAVGIRGILKRNRNAGIAPDILVLHAALR